MYQVIWTQKAIDSFQEISDFVLLQWGVSKVMELEQRIEELQDRLEENPMMFQAVENVPGVRRCVVNKQISLIYEVVEDTVFLYLFVDNRSDHDYT